MDPCYYHRYIPMTHEKIMCFEDKPEDFLQITSLSPVHSECSQSTDWRAYGVPPLPYCVAQQINNRLFFQRFEALTANKCSQTFSIDRPCQSSVNSLNPELNPICYLLALLGAHRFLHVSRIRVKLLTFRLLMSYIYIYMCDISRLMLRRVSSFVSRYHDLRNYRMDLFDIDIFSKLLVRRWWQSALSLLTL